MRTTIKAAMLAVALLLVGNVHAANEKTKD